MAKEPRTETASTAGPPRPSELATQLGGAHAAFEALAGRPGASTEWKRYSKKAPWVLRVSQGDRTLFYLNPGKGSFETTVVLGARATEAALGGKVAKALHAAIRAARAYAEGRPVRVVVKNKADLASVEDLLAAKLDPGAERRSGSEEPARKGRGGPTRRCS